MSLISKCLKLIWIRQLGLGKSIQDFSPSLGRSHKYNFAYERNNYSSHCFYTKPFSVVTTLPLPPPPPAWVIGSGVKRILLLTAAEDFTNLSFFVY